MVSEEELQNMSPEQIAELQKQQCIFCKIIKGDIPGKKVFQDDFVEAILDINPAAKGHTLVMPKEHYPILPLVPPNIFRHMFRVTKDINKAVKKGAVTNTTTIFIANGAIAGQQSPHFLFHIIPREDGDSLYNFSIPDKSPSPEEVKQLFPALKNNLAIMMRNHLMREGKLQQPEATREQLSEIIDQNPQLKELILKEPEKLKQMLATNPQLQALFKGININALSQKLNEYEKLHAQKLKNNSNPAEK